MKLRNFPINNPQPRNNGEMKDYVRALSIKKGSEAVGDTFKSLNDESLDLDTSPEGVAIGHSTLKMGYLGYGELQGTASIEPDSGEVTHIQAEVDETALDGHLSYRQEGEIDRYSYRREYGDVVEHVVHDTASDTISYFHRDPKGRFLPKK